MSIIYGGAHSVLFIDSNGTKTDSWDNMHLIPASRLAVPIPQPSLSIIKVPGSNKIIDMTEYMSTSMTFESVSGAFEFYVDLDQWSSWDECYVYFKNFFAGKVFSFILADNPTYKYTGRLSAQELKSGANWPMLSISYILTKQAESNDLTFSGSTVSLTSDRVVNVAQKRYDVIDNVVGIKETKYVLPSALSSFSLKFSSFQKSDTNTEWRISPMSRHSIDAGDLLIYDGISISSSYYTIEVGDSMLVLKWHIGSTLSSSNAYPRTISYSPALATT